MYKGSNVSFGHNGFKIETASKDEINQIVERMGMNLQTAFTVSCLSLENRITSLAEKIEHLEESMNAVTTRVDRLEVDIRQVSLMNQRLIAAVDLIVGEANLTIEESEIDQHLSHCTAGRKEFNVKNFSSSVSIRRSE